MTPVDFIRIPTFLGRAMLPPNKSYMDSPGKALS